VLPPIALVDVADFCEYAIPLELRDQLRVEHEIAGDEVTIFVSRPLRVDGSQWMRSPIALLHYDRYRLHWALYWHAPDGHWEPYDELPSSPRVRELLTMISEDPTGLFWDE
jgi:hypothetical protein